MRILLLESDEFLARSLATVLRRRGHEIQHADAPEETPDAVILGLPAPYRVTPKRLPSSVPLLVLAGQVPFGELERWIAGRSRWGVMSKPASEPHIARWLIRHSRIGLGANAVSAAPLSPPPPAPR